MRRLPLLAIFAAVLALPASRPLAQDSGAARPGRLVVKYRDLDACLDCRLARGEALATVVGDHSLDDLHGALGVRGARPLFGRRGVPAKDRAAARMRRLDAVRNRFPARAARVPSGLGVPDLSRVYVLELPTTTDLGDAAALYAANPHVAYAHPDYEVTTDLIPNDALFGSLWNMTLVEAPAAWDVATGVGSIVAVVDTGVDRFHPDLSANMWVNANEVAGNGLDDDGNGFVDDRLGWDFVAGDDDPFDDHGHGTHVAGIASATGQNAIGVLGLAFGAQIMAVKGINSGGSGWTSDLAEAIVYAAENGADVINNSWGGPGISQLLVDAVDDARALGAVVVAAAGNNGGNADNHQPSAIPGVIAVGASDDDDEIAYFSNRGQTLSVAAPGVDVLSLRGSDASGLGNDGLVGTQYQRLSGTSMASPHVAGLAALLVSEIPGLALEEVRWHMELNADQPGYPGYEGEPWNPAFGWGRINALRVFDPPSVTTRMFRGEITLHGIVDTPFAGTSAVDLVFTTIDPVPWSLTAPSWIQPSMTSGSGAAHIALDLDPTGLAPGTVAGSVVVDAPTVPDGGGSVPMTLHVHRDERLGGVIDFGVNQALAEGPLVASDGVGYLVTGLDTAIVGTQVVRRLLATQVDGGGNPGPLRASIIGVEAPGSFSIGFDGRQYLAVWQESDDDQHRAWLKGFRLHADGTPIDATPFVITERRVGQSEGIAPTAVGFDGTDFTVLWGLVNSATDRSTVLVRRIGTDGSLRGRRAEQVYPDQGGRTPGWVMPLLTCRPGRCLVAWWESRAGADEIYAIALSGGLPLDRTATRVLTDAGPNWGIASDGTDFAVMVERYLPCVALPTSYGKRVVVARIRPDATPVDPAGTVIDNAGGACPLAVARGGLVFDGTNYAGFFVEPGPRLADGRWETYAFAAHMAPDGTPLADEPTGLLLHEAPVIEGQSEMTVAAASRMSSLFVWAERDPVTGTLLTVRGRRVLPTATTPGYPEVTIGTIGAQSIPERQELLRTVRPPAGLDPSTTVLSATGLPPGAIFDAPTGAFRWRPGGTEAGTYPGVTFTATDASQSVSEAITITVTESIVSFEGTVRLANFTPVTDVGLKIGRVTGERRVAFTDANGRYRVEGLSPKRYSVRLDPASKKRYRQISPRLVVTVGAADTVADDLILETR